MEAKKLLLIKQESSYATDATPGAVDVVFCEDPVFTPKGEFVAGDPAIPGLGGVKGYTVAEYGEFTFSVPLGLSGTAGTAPKWGKLMTACGYAETIVATTSVTYALANDPSASSSVSIIWRDDRRLHKLLGGRGYVSYAFDEKKRPTAKFTFWGLRTPVADGAVILQADATWTGWNDVQPISQAATTFTFNGVTPGLRSFSIDQSANLTFSDRPGQKRVDIAGARTFSGKAKISSMLPSVLSIEALKSANTLVTSTLVHGTTAGSILTLPAKLQITDNPTYRHEDGLDVTEFGFQLKPSAFGTDDQISLVCT